MAVSQQSYEEAVEYYRLAAKCAAKANDPQKESIFNNRAEELIQEFGLSSEIKTEKKFKKPVKQKEPKLAIKSTGIWGLIITVIIILLAYSGVLYVVIFVPNILTIPEMFFFWGIAITIQIVAVIVIIIIYRFLIAPPEKKEDFEKKKL